LPGVSLGRLLARRTRPITPKHAPHDTQRETKLEFSHGLESGNDTGKGVFGAVLEQHALAAPLRCRQTRRRPPCTRRRSRRSRARARPQAAKPARSIPFHRRLRRAVGNLGTGADNFSIDPRHPLRPLPAPPAPASPRGT
jgi:hypothetical protein